MAAGGHFVANYREQGIDLPTGDLRLLPEPDPRDVWCPIISVDDHVLEPADLFHRRVPGSMRDEVPHVVDIDDRPFWIIDSGPEPILGANAASGRPQEEYQQISLRWHEMRPGVMNVDARVHDMDINGVWASLCFPSITWGFAGRRLAALADETTALACVRAYNDWMLEDWCGAAPERFIPCQIPYLRDPQIAAREVELNAARGFKAVSFSENPSTSGFASLYSGEWDMFFAACAATGTVLNLHVGSSGTVRKPSPETPVPGSSALFPISGIETLYDWIFAKIPTRFPELKIVMSEAGASWVPMVVDRLEHLYRRRASFDSWWSASEPPFVELLRRNFWFTSIEDPTAFRNLDVIGSDRIMLEADYPHNDSTWPDTQELIRHELQHLPDDTIPEICYGTASRLYRHPAPPDDLVAQSVWGQQSKGPSS